MTDNRTSYLNKTFSDFKTSLTNYAKTYFPTTYNNFSDANPGALFIDMASYVGDISSFYLDTQVQETFLLYAAQNYNNPSCRSLKEFESDLKRFKYIKRLVKRYKKTGVLSERLILNHLILLHNVFNEATVPMLFLKFESEYWSSIKTFLVFLNYLPEPCKINNTVNSTDINLDANIINTLRKI